MLSYHYHWVSRAQRGQASYSRAHSPSSQDPLPEGLMMPSSPLVPWLSVRESTEAVAGKDPQSRLGSADRWTDAGRPPPRASGL